ncbi:hypothetical protein L6164_001825 [Bauhinia variegata]|uniref:Uncharacterized protein n=1 Tax=Bauhinia variegata TaxID=167791 RepID=A0ACB9QAP4_BAUVA|nr:hypothetical protein L6164_001825 [Bauhinia variegata]
MYVTRPLSMYINEPSALSQPPPEGPNSGILVIEDEEAELTCCFGLCKNDEVFDMPFPQNKDLTLRYSTSSGVGTDRHTHVDHFYAAFVPVLNQPLSANRYYVIQTQGKHKGEAYANSREEDMTTCCFCCKIVDDRPTQALDHNNVYQQFEITKATRKQALFGSPKGFTARAVAPDGIPPHFLERQGWTAHTTTRRNFELGEAQGLIAARRARLPDFDFPLTSKASNPVVVGKWYCPFMFIKEGRTKDQVRNSVYYEMTLEQNWEQIFECENGYGEGNSVVVDVNVETQLVKVFGNEAKNVEVADGVMWFKSPGNQGNVSAVGLSMAIVERMRWEEERVGYVWGNERVVRVKKVEEFGGIDGWKKYACYVLVERFVVRRLDGSLVLTWDFKHTHQIRSKWE